MDKEPSGPSSSTGSRSAGGFGLFGSAGPQYSKTELAGVPLTGTSPLSPYLNVDPRFLIQDPEYGDPPRCHMAKHFGFNSAFGVIFEKARGAEDDLNTIAAGNLTGVLYKSPGLWGAARGGLVGLTLSGLYALYDNWDHLKGGSPTRY